MHTARRITLILAILLGGVGCDQTTKSIAQSYLPSTAQSFLGDTMRLQLAYNPGAFLSLGDSLPARWRYVFFSIGTGVVLLGLAGFALFSGPLTSIGVAALALIFAGGVSNLADRWIHGGNVVDFISVGIGSMRTGIFNVADLLITVGCVLLLIPTFQRTRLLL